MSLEQTPWIAALLTDPSYETFPLPSRPLDPSDITNDNFFSRALNTPHTIPHCILQGRLPAPPSPSTGQPDKLRLFASLGEDVTGHPGVLHGGVIASLLDSVMGLLLAFRGEVCMTSSLNLRFRRPVPAPGAVVVHSWVKEERAGRWIVLGEIVDQSGVVLAGAEGLFVGIKGRESRV